MSPIETLLFALALLIILSIYASKASLKAGIPSLLVFLAIGMLAGSEGIGGIDFDNIQFAQTIGVIALAFILFSGGLDTEWKSVKKSVPKGIVLSTITVLLTCFLVAFFCVYALSFSWLEALLLGAIVSSTDAAAVFSVLRAKSLNLKGETKPVLELESGSNDPMAVFLTTSIIYFAVNKDLSAVLIFPLFFKQMLIGAAAGFVMGRVATLLFRKSNLEYEGLYPVLSIALVILTYTLTQGLGGNGFLSVYITGIILGNQRFINRKYLLSFHDGIAWLMQIAMFICLGLLVYPSKLLEVIGLGLSISIFLIFIARPLSVFFSLVFFKMSIPQKALISWVGLRGAVPIILATFPLIAGIPNSELIFNIVFFIVLTSITIQGMTISSVAKLLKMQSPSFNKIKYPIEYNPDFDVKNDLLEIRVTDSSNIVGKPVVDIPLPDDSLIVLIQRKGDVVIPRGGTIIKANDSMLVWSSTKNKHELLKMIESTDK